MAVDQWFLAALDDGSGPSSLETLGVERSDCMYLRRKRPILVHSLASTFLERSATLPDAD